ncbi:unnamed protein product, partial [Auanema sp. JU1783]
MLPRLFKNPARIINIINTEDRIIPPNGTVCLTLKIDERLKRNEWVCIKPTEDHAVKCMTTAFQPWPHASVAFINRSNEELHITAQENIGQASVFKIPSYDRPIKEPYIPPEADWEAQLPCFPQDFMKDLSLTDADLSKQQKIQLKNVILNNKAAFLNEDRNIGLFTGPMEHSIPLRTDMDMPKSR